jgi:NADH:ubiquinone oxidoreductase subunit 2 (subunit N)
MMYMHPGEPETRSEGWLNSAVGISAVLTILLGILPGPVLALAERSGFLSLLR